MNSYKSYNICDLLTIKFYKPSIFVSIVLNLNQLHVLSLYLLNLKPLDSKASIKISTLVSAS